LASVSTAWLVGYRSSALLDVVPSRNLVTSSLR
jgi:hypothetical protein